MFLASILADPTITSPVGTGEIGFAGDGGPAVKAKLNQPFDVAFDKAGNLYFRTHSIIAFAKSTADRHQHRRGQ